MKNKTKIAVLLISSLMCTTYSVNAQSVYGGYHSSTTHTPTFNGGYRSDTYGSSGGYSSTTTTPTFNGGYRSDTYGSSGHSTTTHTPTFNGGYSSDTYGW